jgi:hypothetical protein
LAWNIALGEALCGQPPIPEQRKTERVV